MHFQSPVDYQLSGSVSYLPPITFLKTNGFIGSVYNNLELADINLRTHKVIESRDEIELSFVLHNRGPIQLSFGHRQVKLEKEGVFKLDHINYIKDTNNQYDYTLKTNTSIPFFERYEIVPFEERVAGIPKCDERDADEDDFIKPF